MSLLLNQLAADQRDVWEYKYFVKRCNIYIYIKNNNNKKKDFYKYFFFKSFYLYKYIILLLLFFYV